MRLILLKSHWLLKLLFIQTLKKKITWNLLENAKPEDLQQVVQLTLETWTNSNIKLLISPVEELVWPAPLKTCKKIVGKSYEIRADGLMD